MKINSIRYPEGCQLKGWSRMVFERRLRRTLGSFFSVCDLDRCRAEILGQEPDKERYEELNVFHCDSFKDMSATEAQALVDKTAEYVGVEISVGHASPSPPVVTALVGGILIGVVGGWAIPAVKDSRNTATSYTADDLPSMVRRSPVLPVLPLPRTSELPLATDPEPVFNTKVRTDRPGATAMTLARTVTNDTGEYEVTLTVTPIEAPTGQ